MDIDVDAERAFHNQRFLHGDNRLAQSKYYWAIEAAARRYWNFVIEHAVDADVLEYGCANGERSRELSETAKTVQGIDISDVAIARATELYGSENVRFYVMDAMNMTFEDQQFDLVFGSGIIHHLDTERSMKEISRVLRPNGRAIFWEPLGLNPVINIYRSLTPDSRTLDEHPLRSNDFAVMRRYFDRVETDFYGLIALAAVPFRFTGFGKHMLDALTTIDRAAFLIPGLRMMAWYTLLDMKK
jgi:SAM-dependent methyltransferase